MSAKVDYLNTQTLKPKILTESIPFTQKDYESCNQYSLQNDTLT